jgi:lauroyl/myristoyl acyltransferase
MPALFVKIALFLLSGAVFALGLHKEAQKNLSLVYSINVTAKQARQYVQKMLTYVLETLTIKFMPPRLFAKIISDKGLAPLHEALSYGRGVILLVLHAGNWELFGCALGRFGYRAAAVVNNPRRDKFITYINKSRLKCGLEIIDINTQNMYRACFKAFARNKIVLIAADTGATDSDKNIPLRVLDKDLPVATGWATLALRARPLVLPVFNYSEKSRHGYVFGKLIDPANYADEKALLTDALAFYAEQLRARPFEWFLPVSSSEVQKTFGRLHK